MEIAALMSIVIILLMIILSLTSLTHGLCLLLMVRILVPEDVRLPFINISLNTGIIVVLFIITIFNRILKSGILKVNKKIITCIVAFCIYCLSTLFLSDYSDLDGQMGYFFQFLVTDILPFILAASILKSKKDVLILLKAFLIACLITTLYGVFSYFCQDNPYRMFWSSVATPIDETYWFGNFTTSTFVSINSFGYFIGLSFPFVAFLYSKNIYRRYSSIVLILLFVCSFMAKKRTTIVVLISFIIMWYISGDLKKRLKYLFYSIPLILIVLIIIFTFPVFENIKNLIVSSVLFWNDNVYNSIIMGNGGSNWELRLRQLTYPFVEINENLIFGHGFGWCTWYLSRGIIHPILYGFETLPAQAICEFGMLSFILYPVIFIGFYKFADAKSKNNYSLLFVITSIIQMFGTGAIYWYLELLIILLMRLVNEKFGGNNETTNINNTSSI